MPVPLPKGVTLRGLEVFESLARTGSVAATANRTGPVGARGLAADEKPRCGAGGRASGQLRRPMTLTPAGACFWTGPKSARQSPRGASGPQRARPDRAFGAVARRHRGFRERGDAYAAARLAEGDEPVRLPAADWAEPRAGRPDRTRELDIAICAAPPPIRLERCRICWCATPTSSPCRAGYRRSEGMACGTRRTVLPAARHGPVDGPADRGVPVRMGLSPQHGSRWIPTSRSARWSPRAPAGRSQPRSACCERGVSRAASTRILFQARPWNGASCCYATDDWTGPIPQQIADPGR
jgi:hypothetical protein